MADNPETAKIWKFPVCLSMTRRTPTVYINGKLLNDHSLQGFQAAIGELLQK